MPKVQCPSNVRTGTFAPADVTALNIDSLSSIDTWTLYR